MKNKISRRELLRAIVATGGGLAAMVTKVMVDSTKVTAQSEDLPYRQNLPVIIKRPHQQQQPGLDSSVVQVHAPSAITRNGEWTNSGSYPYFWQHINQSAVNNMVDEGLKLLTDRGSVSDAWRSLLPNYQPGQGIAIKVSFNNSERCDDRDNEIDAVIEPVNAIVRGLKLIGVLEQDIWVYDAMKVIPQRFKDGNLYPGVKFYSRAGANTCGDLTVASSEYFTFATPGGGPSLTRLPIADVLTRATYLINLPIMKWHQSAQLTLGFKNHFGSTTREPNELHYYFFPGVNAGFETFADRYSPLVDLFLNSNIRGKTILTVGDGLFGAMGHKQPPVRWDSLGNAFPSRMFFSRDPVAIDCIMADWIYRERQFISNTAKYLLLAEQQGLGVCETDPQNPERIIRRNPNNPAEYTKINLKSISMN